MPLVRIDLVRGARSQAEIKNMADVIQECLISEFNAPERDRYQIITQHSQDDMICLDTGLGLERSNKLVFIQIFQQGRNEEQKRALYASLAERLGKEAGVEGRDLIISCVRNEKEDWSFGNGRAQFLTGEL